MRSEGAEDALDALLKLAEHDVVVSEEELRRLLERLRQDYDAGGEDTVT